MVCELQDKIEDLQEMKEIQIKTKSTHGTYSDKLRLCVIQLAGLEVATEKVTPVIQVVSEKLFEKKFDRKELPNSTTVQTIIDKGHFIAKAYIAEKIDNCKNWGLNRDGTSRRKQKIIDTAVTLDNGEIASLGFTHVSRETAKIITDVTKNHLIEIADIRSNSFRKHHNEDFIVNSLAKLAFKMSDRASNEKLADKLLNKWRDEMLKSCENDRQTVC
ncbi:hypothetical protein ACJMK2_019325 [Sinanodonta woodiana]|uniref:Uncharacterized protein n=1 Tax=Sinanodonta woodiana TaxID=1069815 RepID=A0ABD3UHN6_SINWO